MVKGTGKVAFFLSLLAFLDFRLYFVKDIYIMNLKHLSIAIILFICLFSALLFYLIFTHFINF